jgi:hypothetical protein
MQPSAANCQGWKKKTRDAILDKIPVAPDANIAASTRIAPYDIRTVKR